MPKEQITKFDLLKMTNTLALLLAKKTGKPIRLATQKRYTGNANFYWLPDMEGIHIVEDLNSMKPKNPCSEILLNQP